MSSVLRLCMGGAGIQRTTLAAWKGVIAREAERGDGHAGPTDVGFSTPKERGGDGSIRKQGDIVLPLHFPTTRSSKH